MDSRDWVSDADIPMPACALCKLWNYVKLKGKSHCLTEGEAVKIQNQHKDIQQKVEKSSGFLHLQTTWHFGGGFQCCHVCGLVRQR